MRVLFMGIILFFCKAEWVSLVTGLGRAPESLAILGSGALPETGVWMADWARKNNPRIRIYSLEIIPSVWSRVKGCTKPWGFSTTSHLKQAMSGPLLRISALSMSFILMPRSVHQHERRKI
jgi:hypothetical protein